MTNRADRLEWATAIAAAIFSFSIIWISTARYGPGISSDAVHFLSSAENYTQGKGLVNFMGGPLIYWPPLYPFALAVMHKITQLPLLSIGRFLNAISASLMILLSVIFFRRIFPQRLLWRILSLLILTTMLFVYTTGANISTDLIFMMLLIAFFIAAQKFLELPDRTNLLVMAIIAAAAPLLRYVGLMFIPTGMILVFWAYRKDLKRAIIPGILFILISSLPILLWVVLHNYLPYGTLFGFRPASNVSIVDNTLFTFAKISYWFFPNTLTDRIPAWLVWLGIVLILMAISRPRYWTAWLKAWFSKPLVPVLIFSSLYFVMITLSVVSLDHPVSDVFDDRYQSPLIFIVLAGVFLAFEYLVIAPRKENLKPISQLLLLVLFSAWLVYPLYRIYKFTLLSSQNGVIAYNNYNNRQYQDTEIAKFIKTYPFDTGLTIFSNDVEVLYVLAGLTAEYSPRDPINHIPQEDYLHSHYPDWPEVPQAYLIWFKDKDKRDYYSPDQLSDLITSQSIYNGSDGRINLIEPRQTD